MRLYWTFSSMPEFAHLSPDGRKRILRSARARWAWTRMAVQSALLGALAYVVAMNLLGSSSPAYMSILAGVTAGAVVTAIMMQIQMNLARLTMRAQIMNLSRGERVPVCLKCGYDQSGNVTDRCPECGAPIRVPEVGEAPPR